MIRELADALYTFAVVVLVAATTLVYGAMVVFGLAFVLGRVL